MQLAVRPNPFTPNGDGFNDQVTFNVTAFGLLEPRLKILTFEGRLVRTVTDREGFALTWDGCNDHGEEQQPGLYLYIIEDGAEVVASGSVVLAR